MNTIEMDDLERQLGVGLRERAGHAVVPTTTVGRSAIEGRIRQRARHRRVRRTAATIVVLLAFVAAGLAWTRKGSTDGTVVSGPEVPAVHLPVLSLPQKGAMSELAVYSPGRSVYELFRPVGATRSQVYDLAMAVSASSAVKLPTTPGSTMSVTVRGVPATAFALRSLDPAAGLTWQVAPGITALLTTGSLSEGVSSGGSTTSLPLTLDPALAAKLVALADQLVPMSAQAQQRALEAWAAPAGPTVRLTMPTARGDAEMWEVSPSGELRQVVEDRDLVDGAVELDTGYLGGGNSYETPPGQHIRIRGHDAVLSTHDQSTAFGPFAPGRYEMVTWVEGKVELALQYRSGVPIAQIEKLALELAPASAARWQQMIFPTTLRTDLVPMPTNVFGNLIGPGSTETFSGSGTELPVTTTTASGH
jgi:hypothetical protein